MSLFHTFQDILNLELSSTKSITDYLLRFGNTWSQAYARSTSSIDALVVGIRPFFSSDSIKSAILLNLLTEYLNDIVNKLQSKDNQTFKDHFTHVRNLKTCDNQGKAFYTNNTRPKGPAPRGKPSYNQSQPGKSSPLVVNGGL